MKKTPWPPLLFVTGFLLIPAGRLSAAQAALRLQAPSGAVVEFTARSLQPGEVILAVLSGSPGVESAELTFLGARYVFAPNGPGGLPFALLGVDLATKPGSYPLRAEFLNSAGQKESVERYVRIQAKAFARKDIAFKDESLVIPPPEAAERIAREQELLAKAYYSSGAEWLAQSSFRSPLEGRLNLNFGEIRVLNKIRTSRHTGVDIEGQMGQEVAASNGGRVALAMDLYYSGNTVVLDHGLGVFTMYGHFSRLAVQEGQAVSRGDIIGYVGSTGRSTGPHLHWALRLQDARVDPLSLLSLILE